MLAALTETGGKVPAALGLLAERGVSADRSYVYEIRRSVRDSAYDGAGGCIDCEAAVRSQ